MNISELLYYLTDDSVTVAVWDFTAEDEVFCGSAQEAGWEYGDEEVLSFDICPADSRGVTFIINIETEEDDEESEDE